VVQSLSLNLMDIYLCQLENYDLDFIAFMSSLFLLSALEFCKEMTAQIAAGIQPIRVICNSKQIIDVSIFPLRKKERNGKKMAIKVMVIVLIQFFFFVGTSGTLALAGGLSLFVLYT